MRALWAALPDGFDNDGDGKKAKWREDFRTKLMELCTKQASGRLGRSEARAAAARRTRSTKHRRVRETPSRSRNTVASPRKRGHRHTTRRSVRHPGETI